MRTNNRHTKRGTASFITGLIGFTSILVFFMTNGFAGCASRTFLFFLTMLIIPLVFGLLAIFLGLEVSYFSEDKDPYGRIGLTLGIACIVIGIFLTWALSVALHT